FSGRIEQRAKMAHHVADRNFLVRDFVDRPALYPFEHIAEGLDEIEQAYSKARVVIFGDELADLWVVPYIFFDDALLVQHFRRILETLVLEQALHKFLARIIRRLAFLLQGGVGRKQQARLDMDERRRHENEF